MKEKPICGKCIHYYVTWDTGAPKGCKKYGFKSHQIPSAVILKETGSDCLGYKAKNPEKETLDLNDQKNW